MNLIPCPQSVCQKQGTFKIGYFTNILSSSDMNNMFAPLSLKDFIFDELRLELNVKRSFKSEKGINYILTDDNGEGYVLDINEDNIEIIGGYKGLLYGTQTLKQLIIESGAFLPCVHIEDYPSFSARGLYYDVTRGRVPTMDSLKKQIDELAFYKINQFQLYIEHTFAFEGMSEV
jgi:N-acetyl-beta-hexosaminidase